NHPRQNVPAASLGHTGIPGGVAPHPALRVHGEGLMTLKHHHAARVLSQLSRLLHPVVKRQRTSSSAGKLSIVGCENGELRSSPEPLGLSFQGIEAVRIQHQRPLYVFHQAENDLLGPWAAPHPWASQYHITATG